MVAPQPVDAGPVLLTSEEDDPDLEQDLKDIESSLPMQPASVNRVLSEASTGGRSSAIFTGGHALSTGKVAKTQSFFMKQKTWQDPRAEFVQHIIRLLVPPLLIFIAWMSFRATGGCFYDTADMIYAYRENDPAMLAKSDACRLKNNLPNAASQCKADPTCGWHEARSGFIRTDGRCDVKELETIEEFRFVFASVLSATVWESGLMLFFLNYAGIWILLKIWRVMPRETFWVWRALFLLIQPIAFSMGFYTFWTNDKYDEQVSFRAACTAALPLAFSAVAGCSWGCRPPPGMWKRIFRASFYILLFGIYFLFGVYMVESVWLPMSRDAEKEDKGLMYNTVLDLVAATVLFSLYIPIGARVIARQYMRLVDDVRSDIRTRRARVAFLACARACFNVVLDMYRFCYGRALLLRMSPIAFFLCLIRDVFTDFFHFGFKYQESLQVFLMRLDQSSDVAVDDMEISSKEKLVVTANRFWSALNRLGFDSIICWWVQIDCEAVLEGRQIHASRVSVRGKGDRASTHLGSTSLQQATPAEQPLQNIAASQAMHSPATGSSPGGGSTRRASVSMSQMLGTTMSQKLDRAGSREDIKYKRALTFANTRMIADNVPVLTKLDQTVNFVSERSLFSCSEQDMEAVMPVLEFWQREIFVRFQVRMASKIFSSVGLLIGMMFAVQSNTAYIPGFPRADLSSKPAIDFTWLSYLISLIVCDLSTWAVITVYVHLRGVKSWTETLSQFQDLFAWDEDVIFRMFWGNGLYFSFLMMSMMVSGHNTSRLQHITGVDTLTFHHVKEVCSGHF
ncbi:unnamed protein product [Amoebophrya sp. A120]|nr:unnamed protein product [Amoebophrya sp. A120]|eukprot:GSA120T00003500001.1